MSLAEMTSTSRLPLLKNIASCTLPVGGPVKKMNVFHTWRRMGFSKEKSVFTFWWFVAFRCNLSRSQVRIHAVFSFHRLAIRKIKFQYESRRKFEKNDKRLRQMPRAQYSTSTFLPRRSRWFDRSDDAPSFPGRCSLCAHSALRFQPFSLIFFPSTRFSMKLNFIYFSRAWCALGVCLTPHLFSTLFENQNFIEKFLFHNLILLFFQKH